MYGKERGRRVSAKIVIYYAICFPGNRARMRVCRVLYMPHAGGHVQIFQNSTPDQYKTPKKQQNSIREQKGVRFIYSSICYPWY